MAWSNVQALKQEYLELVAGISVLLLLGNSLFHAVFVLDIDTDSQKPYMVSTEGLL